MNEEHKTIVIASGRDDERVTYRAYCQLCGGVGMVQQDRQDAVAIAARHQNQGGYEKSQ